MAWDALVVVKSQGFLGTCSLSYFCDFFPCSTLSCSENHSPCRGYASCAHFRYSCGSFWRRGGAWVGWHPRMGYRIAAQHPSVRWASCKYRVFFLAEELLEFARRLLVFRRWYLSILYLLVPDLWPLLLLFLLFDDFVTPIFVQQTGIDTINIARCWGRAPWCHDLRGDLNFVPRQRRENRAWFRYALLL